MGERIQQQAGVDESSGAAGVVLHVVVCGTRPCCSSVCSAAQHRVRSNGGTQLHRATMCTAVINPRCRIMAEGKRGLRSNEGCQLINSRRSTGTAKFLRGRVAHHMQQWVWRITRLTCSVTVQFGRNGSKVGIPRGAKAVLGFNEPNVR